MDAWTEEKFLLMLRLRNKRIARLSAKESDKPAGTKMIQLGAKYLNDPKFVASFREGRIN